MKLVKAHAFGNDFLLVAARELGSTSDLPAAARAACDRHRGIGADGLIVYDEDGRRPSMRLLNADGSHSEISGNGVRCLAAWLARTTDAAPGGAIDIDTEAGTKRLELIGGADGRQVFRAAMGHPEQIVREQIEVGTSVVEAITL